MMSYHLWQALGKTALITAASAFLHLTFLDAMFILMSTDVIQLIISRHLDA